jgi:hypothetical protein
MDYDGEPTHPDDTDELPFEDSDDVLEPESDSRPFNDETEVPLTDKVLESLADPDPGDEVFDDEIEEDD